MPKVFLVTSGSYTDFGINGVFSTEEKAKEWVRGRDFHYNIEPYELDELDNYGPNWLYTSIHMCLDDGFVAYIGTEDDFSGREYLQIIEVYDGYVYMKFDHPAKELDRLDKELATKVCAEKRMQLIARHGIENLRGAYHRDTLDFLGSPEEKDILELLAEHKAKTGG